MNGVENNRMVFSIDRRLILAVLTVVFVLWHPGFIGSETLTLTTYYPAPYGAYVSLMTTNQTILAYPNGNVGIGTNAPSAKLHVVGGFRLDTGVPPTSGYVLTTDGSGNGTWQPAMKCQWTGYYENTVTACPTLGNQNAVVAARAGGHVQPMAPDGAMPRTGEMLCCGF